MEMFCTYRIAVVLLGFEPAGLYLAYEWMQLCLHYNVIVVKHTFGRIVVVMFAKDWIFRFALRLFFPHLAIFF
uniref:Putative secreted protein n=1 Tax=Anopheles darlingi TaxID=43151 RepID=A0A2M4DIS5_ANODA